MASMDWVYLDNNATTQPAAEVVAAMQQVHEQLWANPSSIHRFGQAVRQRVELARSAVARLIHAKPRELIFTSGGTESNNLALRGIVEQRGKPAEGGVVITTAIEHSAVREPADELERAGYRVVRLQRADDGPIDVGQVAEALAAYLPTARTILLSVQWANNETGLVQPIAAIAECVQQARRAAGVGGHRAKIYLHVDATQAVGKLAVDVQKVGVDLLTLAGHKFHGPKGVGALYVRNGVHVQAQVIGGPQEREKRGGTENTAGIIGLGVAAELAEKFLADAAALARLTALRDDFERRVTLAVPHAVIHSARRGVERLWNTSNMGFAGLEAEAILLGLSERGICASAGAACSSGSLEPSPVLLAMGIAEPVAHGSVRFSISRYTTEAEIDQAVAILPQVVARVGKTMPVGR
jgi:cysteine desulfurase